MPKWILFALLPLLAALLVFGPAVLLEGDGQKPESSTTAAPKESVFRRSNAETRDASRRTSSDLPSGWTVGASMLFVIAIALGGFWVVRRVQGGNLVATGTRNIDVKESRRLGKGRAIHYVRVVDTLLLVAESESGITLLRDMTPQDVREPSLEFDEEEDDDGATPRDLLPPPASKRAKNAKLGDFRELLGKLG